MGSAELTESEFISSAFSSLLQFQFVEVVELGLLIGLVVAVYLLGRG